MALNRQQYSRRILCIAAAVALAGCGRSESPSQPPSPPVAAPIVETSGTEPADAPFFADHRVEPTDAVPVAPQPEAAPAPVFRPSETRPQHDDSRLAEVGIRRYESARLRLYTDIDPQLARTLPPLADRLYQALVDYFGPLPANREETEYQMTGYVMADRDRFRGSGLLPVDLPGFEHGRHRGAEFWMNDQEHDYYRAHLLLHEATHCFMTTMPGPTAPVWYMEGMAELFGTHRVEPDGTVRFRVLPHRKEEFAGLGRITAIETEVAAGRLRTLAEVLNLVPDDYIKVDGYAWSWALCLFLDAHPSYRERFRTLGAHAVGTGFSDAFIAAYADDLPELWTEWALFANSLQHGYDLERAAIDFHQGESLAAGADSTCEIRADRGWQSSGIMLEEGKKYRIAAEGEFTLAQEPKPWVSEPQGITFRYFKGEPLGMLQAAVQRHDADERPGPVSMLNAFTVGRGGMLEAPVTGTLYFRLNDDWSELADNRGTVTVRIVQE